jgi:hypothetical protein
MFGRQWYRGWNHFNGSVTGTRGNEQKPATTTEKLLLLVFKLSARITPHREVFLFLPVYYDTGCMQPSSSSTSTVAMPDEISDMA